MAHQTQEPKVKRFTITVAATDMQQLLTKLKSAVEQIGVDARDLVDKAISATVNLGTILNEVESNGGVVEIRREEEDSDEYSYTIKVGIKGDYNVEVEVSCNDSNYEATLDIDQY